MICRSAHQSTLHLPIVCPPPTPISRRNDGHELNTTDLRVNFSFKGIGVHKNIPVSVTKLTLGLRLGCIISHFTADKIFPVNPSAITGPPKMSLVLEVKSMTALNIKQRFILVVHTDDIGWCITSKQQVQMLVQNINRIVRGLNITAGQILHCTTDCIPINLVFHEYFHIDIQVLTTDAVELTANTDE